MIAMPSTGGSRPETGMNTRVERQPDPVHGQVQAPALQGQLALGVGVGHLDGHQGDREIAQPSQQPVARGVVGHPPAQRGLAAGGSDSQVVEPGRPLLAGETALDPDLIMVTR